MREDRTLMRLLAARVPLTLLMDIVMPPDAAQLYLDEGGCTEWLLPDGGALPAF
jgi:hypothetical protein